MLTSSRLLQAFRQSSLQHETIIQNSLRRTLGGQQLSTVTSRSTPLRRNLTTRSYPSNPTLPLRSWRTPRSRFGRQRQQQQARHNSSKTTPEDPETSHSLTQLTMSERMKAMSKKYGWVVVGIYLGLSALDFPLCFLAVRLFGTDRIAALEHAIMSKFWAAVETVIPSMRAEKAMLEQGADEATREESSGGIVEVSKGKKEDASIWTQLLLAYGVHKSLIFFRIPITLAITPRVVKTLRQWGWSIGRAAK